ncbi:MAG TPA: helix-turn-helix domain-containing protein [Solirubrobacterales bacterium]|nr:helix-turn-helix domain-containing protein [Solirubrobacterales bacterium]
MVRAAARNGVTLDSILVRLISAQALFNEYILDEMGNASGQDMRRVQSLQSSMLTTLTKRLSYEYREELGRKADTAERRRTLLIERLLAGVPIDRRELPYSFDGWHIALVATGRHAANTARLRAESLGTGYLTVIRGNGMVWAWIGSRHMVSVDRVRTALERSPDPKTRVALGEPGEGVDGWRSSHFEARAAHDVAIRLRQDITQFSTVALEAIALQVPDLARSLQAAYLGPLSQRGGGGLALRQTLRAYFAAGRNASSAASALRVTRRTVENRLRTVEAELGRPLNMCGAELEMALRLEDLREGEIPSTS